MSGVTSSFDRYGLPVSSSGAAVEAWLKGVYASLAFDHSGIEEFTTASTLDPEFALAHVMQARQQSIHGHPAAAFVALDKALKLATNVSPREASQIRVLAAVIRHQGDALPLARAHLQHWPLDVVVMASIAGPFGLLAFSGQPQWQSDCVDLLDRAQKHWPEDDWWFLTTRAFSLAEVGRLQEAEALAERAWHLEPTGNCAHTLSHVHFEKGALQDGIAFIDTWCGKQGQQSDMRHHLKWHAALFEFDQGSADPLAMRQLYDNEFDPAVADPMPLTTYTDNASFAWHCAMQNMPLAAELLRDTVRYGKQHFPQLGFAFADLHRVALTALLRSSDEEHLLLEEISNLENSAHAHALSGLWKGFSAFAEGDYDQAAKALESQLFHIVCLGGSNAQRRIVAETWQQACARAGIAQQTANGSEHG